VQDIGVEGRQIDVGCGRYVWADQFIWWL